MPTYEYECRECGHQFETRQSINEPALTKCPECKGDVRRMVSGGSGFIMKASGASRRDQIKGCSLEETGKTCCGASQKCGQSHCGD